MVPQATGAPYILTTLADMRLDFGGNLVTIEALRFTGSTRACIASTRRRRVHLFPHSGLRDSALRFPDLPEDRFLDAARRKRFGGTRCPAPALRVQANIVGIAASLRPRIRIDHPRRARIAIKQSAQQGQVFVPQSATGKRCGVSDQILHALPGAGRKRPGEPTYVFVSGGLALSTCLSSAPERMWCPEDS